MRKVYIVWNEAQNEGFVTDSHQDAYDASEGQTYSGVSTGAADFAERYADDERVIEEVMVTDIGEDA